MSEITLDHDALKNLVKRFEEKEYELTDVPQDLVEQFGYPCLSHSLMFKEPQIPKYDLSISNHIKSHNFDTLDSLISYLSTLNNDINKLFGLFSFEGLKIEPDLQNKSTRSVEEIFQSKKASSEEFCLFFREIAQRLQINKDQITIQDYSNFSKYYEHDPLNLPNQINPNHTSLYVQIDQTPFISEPTFSTGQIDTSKKGFKRDFNPQFFLIPLYNTLNTHYPCGDSQKLLPFKISITDFFESLKISPFEKQVKSETCPFIKFTTSTGYVEQTYSCNSPINQVSFKIFRKEDAQTYKQIHSNDGIMSYEVNEMRISKHKKRCRFTTHILFQQEGFYEVELILDSQKVLNYFVNVLKKSDGSIPVTFNPFHDSKFIPMTPKTMLTKILNGVTIIRFAVAINKSDILWDIVKLNDQNAFKVDGETIERKYGRYVKLLLPFDDERYEDQLCITFPSDGRYVVNIFLANDNGSFSNYTKYFFDVAGTDPKTAEPTSPIYYMFDGRKFAPNKIINDVVIKPNLNVYLVKDKEQTIQIKTKSIEDRVQLEFKQGDKTIVAPNEDGKNGDFKKFKWTIPGDYGEYHLIGWVNGNQSLDLPYIYNNIIFKQNSPEENQMMDDLMCKIRDEDPDAFEAKKERARKLGETKEEPVAETKESSKCCLLI